MSKILHLRQLFKEVPLVVLFDVTTVSIMEPDTLINDNSLNDANEFTFSN